MGTVHSGGVAVLWMAALSTGCGETPPGASKAHGAGASASASVTGSTMTSDRPSEAQADGGRQRSTDAGDEGSSAGRPAVDSGVADANRASRGAGSSSAAGGAGDAGVESQPAQSSVPTPVDEPQIWGFGIGVSDVSTATGYFKDVMKVELEKEAIQRDGWTETMLFSTQSPRGGRLSLLAFDDMRNTRGITAKLIWKVKETGPIDAVAAEYPFYMKYLDSSYVMFEGPDRYIQEISNELDPDGGDFEDPYLVAIGFAVSDGDAARKFYTDLGMTDKSLGSYPITDPTGYGVVGEYSERYGVGRAIVLQTWSPARNAKDNPIKVVIAVPDANAMAEKVVAAGGTIVSQASRSDLYDNRLVVVAKDLDGYTLDLVE